MHASAAGLRGSFAGDAVLDQMNHDIGPVRHILLHSQYHVNSIYIYMYIGFIHKYVCVSIYI